MTQEVDNRNMHASSYTSSAGSQKERLASHCLQNRHAGEQSRTPDSESPGQAMSGEIYVELQKVNDKWSLILSHCGGIRVNNIYNLESNVFHKLNLVELARN